MMLITKNQYGQMIANALENKSLAKQDKFADHMPVVKLFTPDANCTWLLTELDPEEPDIAFGLCDLGMGKSCTELGYVRISELKEIRGRFGLPVERDRHWQATKTLSQYLSEGGY